MEKDRVYDAQYVSFANAAVITIRGGIICMLHLCCRRADRDVNDMIQANTEGSRSCHFLVTIVMLLPSTG